MVQYSLKGKTALVCGSTQGIGWATARAFAAAGARCILLARNETVLREKIDELNVAGLTLHQYLVADFSDLDQLKAVIEKLAADQTIHIVLNNTGGPKAGKIADAAGTDFEAAFRMHLVANQLIAQAVLPGMKTAGYGRIINVISTSVRIPIDNLGVSNTIRAAVASWGKTMANELGAFGITVNSILPGFTDTQRLRSLIEANAQRRQVPATQVEAEMIAGIPAKRFGTADEIAAVAAFLASPAASYVNGVSIPVDGGKTGTI